MSCRATAMLLIGALVSGSKADAASLATVVSADEMSIILRGDIELNDVETLETLIATMELNGHPPQRILLDSPGGNLLGGIGLARFIYRRGNLATQVTYGSTCASACFLVFAAGHEKFADYTSFVGVHGVADGDGRVTTRTTAATLAMARVSEELGVPAAINEKIVITSPSEIVWLTSDDLNSMGVTMIGRPVQSQRGGTREFNLQDHKPAAEKMRLSKVRDQAREIKQALEAAERAQTQRALPSRTSGRDEDNLSD